MNHTPEQSIVGALHTLDPEMATRLTMERLDAIQEIARLRKYEDACAGINPEAVPMMLEALKLLYHVACEPQYPDEIRADKAMLAAIAKAEEGN